MPETALPADPAELTALLESLPNQPAVFLLHPPNGDPLLARTNILRRRLTRILTDAPNYARLEYQPANSKLESRFLHLEIARQNVGPNYRRGIRLRLPPYVKLLQANPFPRTQLANRLSRAATSLYVGPFRNRSTAAHFESAFLDLFQLRRCQEDLAPSPQHPGCIYGEMGRCLRPCQQLASPEEYASEANRVADFLRTGGRTLLASAASERERLSNEMDFEAAARAHQRVQKIEDVLGARDEMARAIDELHAVAIVPSAHPECVELGWLRGGHWQGFRRLDFLTADDGRAVSLDTRLRDMAATILPTPAASATERMDQLAVLSRWFYSTWRDGELLLIDDWSKISWRKLVNAVSRVATEQRKSRPNKRSAQPH